MTYFARKTVCDKGHSHASRAEARRCYHLHQLQDAGEISDLRVEPQFWFVIDGEVVKHRGGRRVGYKPDFEYYERGAHVCEDVKARNGHTTEAATLRMTIFRHLHPGIELRVIAL